MSAVSMTDDRWADYMARVERLHGLYPRLKRDAIRREALGQMGLAVYQLDVHDARRANEIVEREMAG